MVSVFIRHIFLINASLSSFITLFSNIELFMQRSMLDILKRDWMNEQMNERMGFSLLL